ncbi:hypothetical protein [Streptomyces paludis]|uniref:Uncharacterized protein n=1 Tax=Streptomyces paludis TaxID=2282738 RepID=A0A345I108_9ACTN|nr:hypothetical protein [Streptomyces paludis]AXG82632.1 hypothetical protein DVK44_16115 [Streptomyces paludis]
MSKGLRNPVVRPLVTLALAGLAMALWAAWLGWDQLRDEHPDGSTTGPYEAWQVIGLVLTLLPPLYWAASRQYVVPAVLGTTAGLTAAAFYDWSDDASGLFVIGVGMITIATLVTTSIIALLIASTKHNPTDTTPTPHTT